MKYRIYVKSEWIVNQPKCKCKQVKVEQLFKNYTIVHSVTNHIMKSVNFIKTDENNCSSNQKKILSD
ncbi:hypothetical protein BH10ACI1_BH10ACI1_07380 [soil metagenome]